MPKSFVLRTILEDKKNGFHVGIVEGSSCVLIFLSCVVYFFWMFFSKLFSLSRYCFASFTSLCFLVSRRRKAWLLWRVWGASCAAILQKIRILDIKEKWKHKIKIRPTDPLQNLLCNPKHTYIFFWPRGLNRWFSCLVDFAN